MHGWIGPRSGMEGGRGRGGKRQQSSGAHKLGVSRKSGRHKPNTRNRKGEWQRFPKHHRRAFGVFELFENACQVLRVLPEPEPEPTHSL